MTKVDISPHNERVFVMGVHGGQNVQYLLFREVEDWLNASGSYWELEGGGRHWNNIPEIQVWFMYCDMIHIDGPQLVEYGPAVFSIEDPDTALLFKMTWGGI
jgi:hypothetical protein